MDMCYVAAGRLEAYWEGPLQIYDIAAGWIIVNEAGGRVSDFGGELDRLCDEIIASNGILHEELMGVIAPCWRD